MVASKYFISFKVTKKHVSFTVAKIFLKNLREFQTLKILRVYRSTCYAKIIFNDKSLVRLFMFRAIA